MKMTRKEWFLIAGWAQMLAQTGQMIAAIRYLRNETGCFLKDAHAAAYRLRDIRDQIKPL